jgi:hypothetical protein
MSRSLPLMYTVGRASLWGIVWWASRAGHDFIEWTPSPDWLQWFVRLLVVLFMIMAPIALIGALLGQDRVFILAGAIMSLLVLFFASLTH